MGRLTLKVRLFQFFFLGKIYPRQMAKNTPFPAKVYGNMHGSVHSSVGRCSGRNGAGFVTFDKAKVMSYRIT